MQSHGHPTCIGKIIIILWYHFSGLLYLSLAGQTVFHVHVHLIPRRIGDVENPKGGVRGVIPAKQKY